MSITVPTSGRYLVFAYGRCNLNAQVGAGERSASINKTENGVTVAVAGNTVSTTANTYFFELPTLITLAEVVDENGATFTGVVNVASAGKSVYMTIGAVKV